MKATPNKFLGGIILALSFLFISCQSGTQTSEENSSITDKIEETIEDSFDPDEYPLILRRTTLIVRDIEKSLALYKDAIGMEIIYDNIIKRKHPTEEGDQEIRLVFLKATTLILAFWDCLSMTIIKKIKR